MLRTLITELYYSLSDAVVLEQDSTWMQVLPNETVPFTFGGRGKVRHRDTHTVRVHQLAVRVDMWKPAAPVSVDKVGVYFRQAAPNVDKVCQLYRPFYILRKTKFHAFRTIIRV